jgi:hypothetical protein
MTSPRSFEALVLITDKSRVPDSDAQSVRLNPREPLSLSPTGFPRRLSGFLKDKPKSSIIWLSRKLRNKDESDPLRTPDNL